MVVDRLRQLSNLFDYLVFVFILKVRWKLTITDETLFSLSFCKCDVNGRVFCLNAIDVKLLNGNGI